MLSKCSLFLLPLGCGREDLIGNSYLCSITCLWIGGWFSIHLFLEHPSL